MKKLITSLFIVAVFLGTFSLYAEQVSESSIVSKLGQSASISEDAEMTNILFGERAHSLSSKSEKTYTTDVYFYQYTTDGSALQHVGVYADCVICINVSGPREGTQFIIANNGAVADMCHSYTKYKDHFTNKYTWGEVNTYEEYQKVTIK